MGIRARDVPELLVRNGGVGRGGAGDVELERGDIPGGGAGADGAVGAQEGGQVQAGIWRAISKEAVCHDTGDLVIVRTRGDIRGQARSFVRRKTERLNQS